MANYDIKAIPTGKFASRLEAEWDVQFRRWQWDADYIGNNCFWSDFRIDGIEVEVKPNETRFIEDAVNRWTDSPFLIISGHPPIRGGIPRWWLANGGKYLDIYPYYYHYRRPQTFMEYFRKTVVPVCWW